MLIFLVLSWSLLLTATQGSKLSFKWNNGWWQGFNVVDSWSYFINFIPTSFPVAELYGVHFTERVMTPTRSGALTIRSRNPIGVSGQFVCIINIVTRVTVSCTEAQVSFNVILNGLNTNPSDKFIMTLSNKQSMVYSFPTTSGHSQLYFDGNTDSTKSVSIRCQDYPCQYIPASSNGDVSVSRYVARPMNHAQLKMWILHPKRSLDLLVCVTSTAKETFHYLDPCFLGKSTSYNQAQIVDGNTPSTNLYTTGTFRPYQPPSTPPALMTVPAGTIVSKDRRLEVTVHLYVDATRENRTVRMNCSSTNGWCRTIPEPVLVDFSFLHYDFRTPEVITNVLMLADVESEFYIEARMLNVGEKNYEICVKDDDDANDMKCVPLPSSGATTHMDIKTGLAGSSFSKAYYVSRSQSILIKYEPVVIVSPTPPIPDMRLFYTRTEAVTLKFVLAATRENRTIAMKCSKLDWCLTDDNDTQPGSSFLHASTYAVSNEPIESNPEYYVEVGTRSRSFRTPEDLQMCVYDSSTLQTTCLVVPTSGEAVRMTLTTTGEIKFAARNFFVMLTMPFIFVPPATTPPPPIGIVTTTTTERVIIAGGRTLSLMDRIRIQRFGIPSSSTANNMYLNLLLLLLLLFFVIM